LRYLRIRNSGAAPCQRAACCIFDVAGEVIGDRHETNGSHRCGFSHSGRRRGRGCSRNRIRAGGQSIQPPGSHGSLEPPKSVSARRQQPAGFGPPALGGERFARYIAIAHVRAAVHGEGQAKAEGPLPGLPRTSLRRWHLRRADARRARGMLTPPPRGAPPGHAQALPLSLSHPVRRA
jgi:hypothetical protein